MRNGGVTETTESTVVAPAKLTLSLRVTGVRSDGYHLLDAEMVSIDLVDSLTFGPGSGISVVDEVVGGLGVAAVPPGADNLVARALSALDRRAAVRIVKRIPAGAGLGGGSTDAAAVLRWAGSGDLALAAGLGSDVPFCVRGGRARVRAGGESVEALPFEARTFVLVVPPLAVDTGAVYGAWDAATCGCSCPPRRRGWGSRGRKRPRTGRSRRGARPRCLARRVGGGHGLPAPLGGERVGVVRRGNARRAGPGGARLPGGGGGAGAAGGGAHRANRRPRLSLPAPPLPSRAAPAHRAGAVSAICLVGPARRRPTCRRPAVASGWPSASSCASSCACACGASL